MDVQCTPDSTTVCTVHSELNIQGTYCSTPSTQQSSQLDNCVTSSDMLEKAANVQYVHVKSDGIDGVMDEPCQNKSIECEVSKEAKNVVKSCQLSEIESQIELNSDDELGRVEIPETCSESSSGMGGTDTQVMPVVSYTASAIKREEVIGCASSKDIPEKQGCSSSKDISEKQGCSSSKDISERHGVSGFKARVFIYINNYTCMIYHNFMNIFF